MAKKKAEILQKELDELSKKRKEVETQDKELEEQEKPMRQGWEQENLKLKKLEYENSEISRKLTRELEELRKACLKEPEEDLRKIKEHVKKLLDEVQTYERLYQESQARLSAIKKDLSDPMTSFLQTPEMDFDSNNPLNPITPAQIATRNLLDLESFHKYEENLKKHAEETIEKVEYYKKNFDNAKAQLKIKEQEFLKIEPELILRLESAKIAFPENSQYVKLKAQLQELATQKQELDIQKRELYSKMYERDLATREKISRLEGERVEKENQLKIEKFKLKLGKTLDLQKILAEEVSLATNDQEREELQQVQQSIEKRIKHLQDEISHYEQILTPQQEPSSSSSSSSGSSSSIPSSYSSSSSSFSDSTTSEMSLSAASAMDLISLVSPISSSSTGSNLSEEIHSLGDTSHEGSDL